MFPEKLSKVAEVGGAGVAVVSGTELILGLTPGQWSVVGVIGGLVIGLIGLCFNIYFQAKRAK